MTTSFEYYLNISTRTLQILAFNKVFTALCNAFYIFYPCMQDFLLLPVNI